MHLIEKITVHWYSVKIITLYIITYSFARPVETIGWTLDVIASITSVLRNDFYRKKIPEVAYRQVTLIMMVQKMYSSVVFCMNV
jgi:hypothetical protein